MLGPLLSYVHIIIGIKNEDNIFDHILALANIVDGCSPCKVSIHAIYCKTGDKKETHYKIKLPIISIIPMYITIFFWCKKFLSKEKKSLF